MGTAAPTEVGSAEIWNYLQQEFAGLQTVNGGYLRANNNHQRPAHDAAPNDTTRRGGKKKRRKGAREKKRKRRKTKRWKREIKRVRSGGVIGRNFYSAFSRKAGAK